MISLLTGGIRNALFNAKALVSEGIEHFNYSNLKAPGVWGLLTFFSVGSLFTYDLNINRADSTPEISILVFSQLIFVALYGLTVFSLKPGSNNRAGRFAIALAAMVMLKAWIIELAFHEQISDLVEAFIKRLPGDLSLTFVLFYIANELNYASDRHERTLQLLQHSKDSLKHKQLEAKRAALEIDNSLSVVAQNALSAPLDQLKEKLTGTKKWEEVRLLSSEIRELINSQVRPLSKKLRERVETLDSTREINTVPQRIKFRIPKNLNAHRDLDIFTAFFVAMPNIFITTLALGGWQLLGLSLLVGTLVLPIGTSLKRLLSEITPKGLAGNWALSNVILLIAFLPMQSLFFLYSQVDPGINPLRISGLGVFLGVGTLFALLSAVEYNRRAVEQDFENLNLQIARETAIVEQQVWVAKKKWAYLVHGTVQGALTVAASRLQLADEHKPADIGRIVADLDKAARALSGEVEDALSLDPVLKEIKDTWDGVLDIEVSVSRQARPAIENPLTTRCIAELVKELSGNAYRHGGATKLYVAIELDDNQDVLLSASNNGEGISAGSAFGLGSQLFDDLTMSWSRSQDEGGVNFQAVLPAVQPRSESSQALADS